MKKIALVIALLFVLPAIAFASQYQWLYLKNINVGGHREDREVYGYWQTVGNLNIFMEVDPNTNQPIKGYIDKNHYETQNVYDHTETKTVQDTSGPPRVLKPVRVDGVARYWGGNGTIMLPLQIFSGTQVTTDSNGNVISTTPVINISDPKEMINPYSTLRNNWKWITLTFFNPNSWPVNANISVTQGVVDGYSGNVYFEANETKELLLNMTGTSATTLNANTGVVNNYDPLAPDMYKGLPGTSNAKMIDVHNGVVVSGAASKRNSVFAGQDDRCFVYTLSPCFKEVPNWQATSPDARWGRMVTTTVPAWAWNFSQWSPPTYLSVESQKLTYSNSVYHEEGWYTEHTRTYEVKYRFSNPLNVPVSFNIDQIHSRFWCSTYGSAVVNTHSVSAVGTAPAGGTSDIFTTTFTIIGSTQGGRPFNLTDLSLWIASNQVDLKGNCVAIPMGYIYCWDGGHTNGPALDFKRYNWSNNYSPGLDSAYIGYGNTIMTSEELLDMVNNAQNSGGTNGGYSEKVGYVPAVSGYGLSDSVQSFLNTGNGKVTAHYNWAARNLRN
ncbi:MAG: hypothetical protein ACOY46_02985 [Bacillota bacterium]